MLFMVLKRGDEEEEKEEEREGKVRRGRRRRDASNVNAITECLLRARVLAEI